MRYEQVKKLDDEKFRRLTGVKRETFEKMHTIISEEDRKKKSRGGRKSKLSLEDQLLISLEYIREYRTYFHIAKSYGVSESTAFKTVRWVEDTLIKHPDFALPGRKALLKSDFEYDVILIDATETPIERPKKGKKSSTQARKSDIL
jgi:transposase